jgi:hypothetical protein
MSGRGVLSPYKTSPSVFGASEGTALPCPYNGR